MTMTRSALGFATFLTLGALLAAAPAGAILPEPVSVQPGARALPPRVQQALRLARRRPAPVVPPAALPQTLAGVEAASLATTFARAYGGPQEDSAGLAKATSDGGFILTGETESFGAGEQDAWVLKVNSSGAIVWEKTFGTAGGDIGMLEQTADGGFVLGIWTSNAGGGGAPFTLLKLTEAGAITWQKSYGTPNDTFSSVQVINGGYLLEASRSDYMGQVFQDILVRLDSNGAILWQKSYTSSAMHTGFAIQLDDGSFALSGSRVSFANGESDLFLAKLNSNGVVQWQKTYGGPEYDGATYAYPTTDGGFVFVGMTQSFGVNTGSDEHFDVWVFKLDSSGNPQWGNAYGGPNDEFGTIMPVTGGYLFTGVTDSFGANGDNLFLAPMTSTGAISWAKAYGGGGDDLGAILPDTSGGGYLLQATTDSFQETNDNFWLAKLDASGNVSWQHTYGGGADDLGAATRLADGGLLLTGDTKSWGAGDWDAWLIKLGSTGEVAGACPISTNPDVQPTPFTFTVTPALPTVGTDDLVEATTAYAAATSTLVPGTSAATVTDLCTATQNVAATASATPTSGAAPLTVAFTGGATGGTPPYSYSWDFGDLTDLSTQQNPSHTYTEAGSYSVTLTVTDAAAKTATDQHLTINVTGGTGECAVACSANVPTSGTVGQALAFVSTATATNCLMAPMYMWDFGDGGSAMQQSPSHAYTAPGTYDWSLTVIAGTGFCTKNGTITITAGGACTITSCNTTVPTTGTVGAAVPFAVTLVASGCTGSPTWAWTFGDGGTANTQNPTHAYAAAGTYPWTLNVSQNGQSCSKSGSIAVSGGGGTTYTYWVPSIAHLKGAGTSKWRSNIAVVNRSGADASLTLDYVPYAAGSVVSRTYVLGTDDTVEWSDVLVTLFGFADTASPKGTVKITSNVPVQALARTYNQADTGTFGQYYPALTATDGISGAQAAVLPLLKKNAAFRTNVGFQNLTGASCSGEVKLYGATGSQVGSTRTLTAAADKFIQEDDIFVKAGAGTQDVAYARVQVTTAGCKAWFFGSVVDAVTNDPTTVPQVLSVAGPYWVPSIAHLKGAGTSQWRSNIAVVNRSGATANLTLVYTPYSAGATVTREHALANNAAVEWSDVLVTLFNFANTATPKGTVKITSDRPVFAMARTYNQADSGTFGQYYPALVAGNAITSGQTAVLPLLKKSASFRSNVAFQNLGDASCTGTVKLYDAAGAQVGTTRTLTAAVDKYIQEDDTFVKAGAGNREPAYAVVEVTTAGGLAWFSGSVIDATTNDPTTVPQQR